MQISGSREILEDNHRSLQFLSAHLEQIGDSATNLPKLMAELKQATSSPEVTSGGSLLEHLIDSDSTLIHLLQARYGIHGFFGNLLKFCYQEQLKEQVRSQTALCKILIEKSKLLFNRIYFRSVNQQPDHPCLHSTTLTHIAETVGHNLKQLEVIHQCCLRFHATNFAGHQELIDQQDERIAAQLGFSSVDYSAVDLFSSVSDGMLKADFHFLTPLRSYLHEAIDKPQYSELAELNDVLSQLEFVIAQCKAFRFPEIAYFEGFEKARVNFIHMQCKLSEHLWNLLEGLDGFLSKRVASTLPSWPLNIERRMTYSFILKGQTPEQAVLLCRKLSEYCHRHSIIPEDMLDEEWQKIDSKLDSSDLALLKSLFAGKLPAIDVTTRASERADSLKRSKSAMKFAETINQKMVISKVVQKASPLLLAFGLFLSGCGVKTRPVSKLADPRPSAPFLKQTQNQNPQLQEKTKMQKDDNE